LLRSAVILTFQCANEAASSGQDGACDTCSVSRSNSAAGRSPPINCRFNNQEGVPLNAVLSTNHLSFRNTRRPVQGQSSLLGLALQSGVRRSASGSNRNSTAWNLRMRLECQIDDMKSPADEDCVSMLCHAAEWANEIVSVQHRRGIVRAFRRREHDLLQFSPRY